MNFASNWAYINEEDEDVEEIEEEEINQAFATLQAPQVPQNLPQIPEVQSSSWFSSQYQEPQPQMQSQSLFGSQQRSAPAMPQMAPQSSMNCMMNAPAAPMQPQPQMMNAPVPPPFPSAMPQQAPQSQLFGAASVPPPPQPPQMGGFVAAQSVPPGAAMPRTRKVHRQRVDTNVVDVKLNCLSSEAEIATGDPVICTQCHTVLNVHSKLVSKPEPSEYLWICEFCGENNEVDLEEPEIPRVQELTYIIENPQIEQNVDNTSYVIFCIDISGSMCVTKPVSSPLKLKTNRLAELQKLATYEDGPQFMPGQRRDMVYVSRLECVQAAIESSIQSLQQTSPNVKVGLVTFNGEVRIIGDGRRNPEVLAGDKLNSLERCQEVGAQHSAILSGSVSDCGDELLKNLMSLEETGPTALGPALAASVSLANQGAVGSKVIICTDGLANVGLGSFDNVSNEELEQIEAFYTSVGVQAKDAGTTVSIVSIEGEECKLEYLSSIADVTGGDLTKVDPERIQEDFANILSQQLIAKDTRVTVNLHKALVFRNEEEENLSNGGSTLNKYLGNITNENAFTFEYDLKPRDRLQSEGIDLGSLTAIPFQVKIDYSTLSGMKCARVISNVQQKTASRQQAEEEAKFDILQKNARIKTGYMADQGNYEQASAQSIAWRNVMSRNVNSSVQAAQLDNYMSIQSPFIEQIQQHRMEEQQMGFNYEDADQHTRQRRRRAAKHDKMTALSKQMQKRG